MVIKIHWKNRSGNDLIYIVAWSFLSKTPHPIFDANYDVTSINHKLPESSFRVAAVYNTSNSFLDFNKISAIFYLTGNTPIIATSMQNALRGIAWSTIRIGKN